MKKWVLVLLVVGSLCSAKKIHAQAQEVQQLLLDVEKLAQLKNILSDMKTGYEILSCGYSTIKSISQGTFDLHKAFLDGLLDVSPVVKNYKRVADIITTQVQLVNEYKKAFKQFQRSGSFTTDELSYISRVYSNLFDGSLKNLVALARIVTAGHLRMSDDERLNAVDAIWKEVEDQFTFLKHFNNETKLLVLQRTKEQQDVSGIKNLYNFH